MTTYAVFDKDATAAPAVVADRFSWFAAVLPPVFALVHGLWLELVAYVIVVMLLGASTVALGDDAAFWIYVVFAIWLGFEAPALRRAALARRGWRYRTEVVAPTEDLAQLEGLREQGLLTR
jgi:hypothetical protein